MAEMQEALGLLATVERNSALLRGLPLEDGPVEIAGSWAIRPGRVPADRMPLTLPPADERRAVGGAPVRADALLLGRASTSLLRLRGFYFDAGITVAAQGRLPLGRRSGLLAGAAVLDRLRGRGSLVLPAVRDRGRRLRHAWLVEELLDGRRFDPPQFRERLPELGDGLAELWLAGGVRRIDLRALVDRSVVASIARLLDAGDGPPGRRPDLVDQLARLALSRQRAFEGWCHGDPVHGNWLHLSDGRVALIDWELARRRPLGHDASKMLIASPDPLAAVGPAAARLERFARPTDAPWRLQVAASLARWIAAWPEDRAIAERTRAMDAYHRRLGQRLDLLEQLLA